MMYFIIYYLQLYRYIAEYFRIGYLMGRAQLTWIKLGWADGPDWIQIFVNLTHSDQVDLLKTWLSPAYGLKWAEIAWIFTKNPPRVYRIWLIIKIFTTKIVIIIIIIIMIIKIIAYYIYSIMISHWNSTNYIPNLASLLYLNKLDNPLESTGLT